MVEAQSNPAKSLQFEIFNILLFRVRLGDRCDMQIASGLG